MWCWRSQARPGRIAAPGKTMNINKASWDKLREEIELSLSEDYNITNVIINYKIKEANKSKNILTFNAIIK